MNPIGSNILFRSDSSGELATVFCFICCENVLRVLCRYTQQKHLVGALDNLWIHYDGKFHFISHTCPIRYQFCRQAAKLMINCFYNNS